MSSTATTTPVPVARSQAAGALIEETTVASGAFRYHWPAVTPAEAAVAYSGSLGTEKCRHQRSTSTDSTSVSWASRRASSAELMPLAV